MRWLVTGGSGFIGTNLVAHLRDAGDEAVVLDDLSRDGSELNAAYLATHLGLAVHRVDVSDAQALEAFFAEQGEFDAIAHTAGQVSLLSSIQDPRRDFEINALGTFNVLDHVRQKSPGTAVIGMSSNKVYGDLTEIPTVETATRYTVPTFPHGFDESLPLDFHGPYGCSKGTADQYLLDFGRIYGLRTASLRQSSVYGPFQHPRADQGWVAHLVEEALAGRPIQLNGIGKQVRDLLHASDLARLFVALAQTLVAGAPEAFNVGGGAGNSLSILELFAWLEQRTGRAPVYATGVPRPSDQLVYVSNLAKVTAYTGWTPQVSTDEGLEELLRRTQQQAAGD